MVFELVSSNGKHHTTWEMACFKEFDDKWEATHTACVDLWSVTIIIREVFVNTATEERC